MPQEPDRPWFVNLFAALVAIFLFYGGASWVRDYFRSKQSYDVIATLHDHGEWTAGEYRDCFSVNLKEERDKPEIVCEDADAPARTFKIRFVGSEPYDENVKEFTLRNWVCRRVDRDVTFSCAKKEEKQAEK
jgi:hypothetical protein